MKGNTKTVKVGQKYKLPVTVTPEGRENEVEYVSSHEQFATVSPTGEVEGRSQGVSTVTATLDKSTDKITINVVDNSQEEEEELGDTETV
ncbi:hypothetical protein F2O61_04245 [Staphylococcus pseudintermedius]|nr:hypothetical protein [Staphylococcus pseudintermedius]EHS7170543.1 Ig-like domain-containing protein [Staphylococcus pseudintermedius]ELW0070458.1 Ig-like domain-containing protein [Staphylococcus pseudintermedius]